MGGCYQSCKKQVLQVKPGLFFFWGGANLSVFWCANLSVSCQIFCLNVQHIDNSENIIKIQCILMNVT